MLKSLRNHEAGSAACRHYHNQPDEMADCWCGPMQRKIKSLMMIEYIAIEFVQARQIGLKVQTYNFADVMGWRNSKRIK